MLGGCGRAPVECERSVSDVVSHLEQLSKERKEGGRIYCVAGNSDAFVSTYSRKFISIKVGAGMSFSCLPV